MLLKIIFLFFLKVMCYQLSTPTNLEFALYERKNIAIETDTLPFIEAYEIKKNEKGEACAIGLRSPIKTEMTNEPWYSEEELLEIQRHDADLYHLIQSFQQKYQPLPEQVKSVLDKQLLFILYNKDKDNFVSNAVSIAKEKIK